MIGENETLNRFPGQGEPQARLPYGLTLHLAQPRLAAAYNLRQQNLGLLNAQFALRLNAGNGA